MTDFHFSRHPCMVASNGAVLKIFLVSFMELDTVAPWGQFLFAEICRVRDFKGPIEWEELVFNNSTKLPPVDPPGVSERVRRDLN